MARICAGFGVAILVGSLVGAGVSGPAMSGTPPTAAVVVPIPASMSVVTSSATPTITAVGQQLPYSFLVTNIGRIVLSNVGVTDVQAPRSSSVNLSAVVCPVTTLNVGASTTCTATYTVTQADVDNRGVTNTATAHGTPPGGTAVDSLPDTLTIPAAGLAASIGVVKSSLITTLVTSVGEPVPYQYHIVNTGNLTLTNVNVTDASASNTELSPILCGETTLGPGAVMDCWATYTATQADIDNGRVTGTATAHGTPPSGTAVDSLLDTLTIPAVVPTAAIALIKTTGTTVISRVGQDVYYGFRVMNTGGVTLGFGVYDRQAPPSRNDDLLPMGCAQIVLAPGEVTGCSTGIGVTQADLDHGSLSNTATAVASAFSGRRHR